MSTKPKTTSYSNNATNGPVNDRTVNDGTVNNGTDPTHPGEHDGISAKMRAENLQEGCQDRNDLRERFRFDEPAAVPGEAVEVLKVLVVA